MDYDERYVVTQINAESFLKLNKIHAEIMPENFLALTICFLAVELRGLSGDVTEIQSAVTAIKANLDLQIHDNRKLHATFSNHYSELRRSPRSVFNTHEAVRTTTYLIDKFICDKYSIPHTRPIVFAKFIKSLQLDASLPLIDMIPLASELAMQGIDYGFYLPASSETSWSRDILKLKLYLNDVSYQRFKDLDNLPERANYIFDYPGSHIQLNATLGIFEKFLTTNRLKGRAAVVVPLGKETPKDIAKYITPFIGQQLHLDAAITIPTSEKRKSNSTVLILLLSDHPSNSDGYTLYLDVSRSNPSVSELDPEDCALLASAVFNLHAGRRQSYDHLTPKVENILNAQFPNGYQNVKWLCTEVAHNHRKAIKIHPVKSILNRQAKQANALNFSADLRELISRIQTHDQPTCTYVIGSNGAGKSLMLRELIYSMAESNVEIVGISTGVHDRFPLGDDSLKLFSYKGLRSRSEGITIPRLAQNATKLAAHIFKNQDLIDALRECLFSLGYEPRHYLVRKPQSTLEELPAHIRFIPLGALAADNTLPPDLNNYEFGVVRSDDKDRITPISSLSSGEQNINYLLLTILRSAAREKVYLLDEPEISLHLQWQQAIPKVLSIMASRFGMSFVVATHSPTLISNANEPNSFSYDLRQGKLRLLTDEQRYSVESIILEGFGTYTPNNRGVHEKCARLVAGSMTESDDDVSIGNDSLKQLSELKSLLLAKTNSTSIPGMTEDLDLIQKAYTAIELLMKDRQVQDELLMADTGRG